MANRLVDRRGVFRFRLVPWPDQQIDAIEADYDAHSRAACEIAESYFSAERVVQSLMTRAGL